MWGATSPTAAGSVPSRDFNPRTPCGVRHDLHEGHGVGKGFQSTHPVWGATRRLLGCLKDSALFQSTHPVWGATSVVIRDGLPQEISIHAPRVGCDVRRPPRRLNDIISIHAPRVGCDAVRPPVPSGSVDFNPRTPCGVRQHEVELPDGFSVISIHAPRVGCDARLTRSLGTVWTFQSTHPVWGATPQGWYLLQ